VNNRPAVIGGVVAAVGAAAVAGAAGLVRQRRAANERALFAKGSGDVVPTPDADRESIVRTEDGVVLHVEEIGPNDAPLTVIFAHGFTLNLKAFRYQRAALKEVFGDQIRMVFYDHRGHGRSAGAARQSCTLGQLARDLYSVIDVVAPDGPVVLVGHSMGGMTIMRLAEAHPELFRIADGRREAPARVQGVALMNTSPGGLGDVATVLGFRASRLGSPIVGPILRRAARHGNVVERGRAMGREAAMYFTRRFAFGAHEVHPREVVFCSEMIASTRVEVVSDFYPTFMEHDGTLGLMNLVDTDVVVLGSTGDVLTPHTHSETIAAALPKSDLQLFTGSGHMLMLEYPDVVNDILIGLVRRTLERAKPKRRVRAMRAAQ